MSRLAFIGCGRVGGALADRLQRVGHDVTLAAEDAASNSVRAARARNPGLAVASPRDAVRGADVVFLATPFQANEAALAPVAAELADKVLVDCTNPVGPGLSHGLGSARSGAEAVQALVPQARVVKAFSIYGYENFEDSAYPGYGVKPAMLLCGREAGARRVVGELAAQLGWQPVDVGGLEQALHLEHMTLLWIRMARAGGRSPHFVWAMLERAAPSGV
ncbi:MAG: NADPH-dependent F420 reductase [Acidobacteriota bacterium]